MIEQTRAGLARWTSMIIKEFLQLKRDRVTFGMIIGLPLVQLMLFGFAINSDPKHMPMGLLVQDQSDIVRTMIASLKNSEYFDIVGEMPSEDAAREALAQGEIQFLLNIPPDFTRQVLRGERPAVLIEADATDPAATGLALAAVSQLADQIARRELVGTLSHLAPTSPPFEPRVHRMYNPEGNTRFNIVPGLMGVILTMTMVLMTGLAITRERERGTMENLLAMPVLPIEVLAGKIIPYIAIGLIQATIILLAARAIFHVPFFGNVVTLYMAAFVFIGANLMVGITISSLARNQLQAMQMTFFFFLPNILLSGFMFPFRGMPMWAQHISSVLPLTHFLRVVRGIILKGNTLPELWTHIWPMALFGVTMMVIAVRFYRRTLD